MPNRYFSSARLFHFPLLSLSSSHSPFPHIFPLSFLLYLIILLVSLSFYRERRLKRHQCSSFFHGISFFILLPTFLFLQMPSNTWLNHLILSLPIRLFPYNFKYNASVNNFITSVTFTWPKPVAVSVPTLLTNYKLQYR